jgi:hypothetical protein
MLGGSERTPSTIWPQWYPVPAVAFQSQPQRGLLDVCPNSDTRRPGPSHRQETRSNELRSSSSSQLHRVRKRDDNGGLTKDGSFCGPRCRYRPAIPRQRGPTTRTSRHTQVHVQMQCFPLFETRIELSARTPLYQVVRPEPRKTPDTPLTNEVMGLSRPERPNRSGGYRGFSKGHGPV